MSRYGNLIFFINKGARAVISEHHIDVSLEIRPGLKASDWIARSRKRLDFPFRNDGDGGRQGGEEAARYNACVTDIQKPVIVKPRRRDNGYNGREILLRAPLGRGCIRACSQTENAVYDRTPVSVTRVFAVDHNCLPLLFVMKWYTATKEQKLLVKEDWTKAEPCAYHI